MTPQQLLLVLILACPLVGLTLNLVLTSRLKAPIPGIIASAAAGLAFVGALVQIALLAQQTEAAVVQVHILNWIAVGSLQVGWDLRADALSAAMMAMVTGVGALIHLYSIGYMRHDERFTRFFVYLNLFLVAMLLLVAADNYAVLFVGWEGVGLCSYLLIGFWFDNPNGQGTRNSTAGRKAFVVNRIGDAGLLIGFGLIFWTFGSLQFDAVFAGAATLQVGGPVAVGIAFCLLLGALGKSAQIPLFVWLPDAMAGPSPVSALIHAATMVTAGVFLIVRSGALFALAPVVQSLIVLLGALTALLGATAAIAQHDIKRTLAYSTISQLGFMMVAVGMGAYTAGMFHLITHAFFKALLFLSAGSVVHAMEHALHALPSHNHHRKMRGSDAPPAEQDMRLMGGLRTRMPLTFWAYTFGALALAGLPPLAGFFSKDAILGYASEHNSWAFLALAISAGFTAFYIGKQWFTVFFGAPRSRASETVHESPGIMTRPLLILAALCVLGGAINLPGLGTLAHWLGEEDEPFHLSIAVISVALAVIGLALAYLLYGRRPLARTDADPLEANARGLMATLRGAWGIDDLYHRTVMRAFDLLGLRLARGDVSVFDGIDRLVVDGTRRVVAASETTQTGQLNWNMAGLLGGAIVVFAIVVWIGVR